jgi:hypothetical protein
MYGLNLSTYDIRYVRDNLLPISNNIYNLGSSTYRFANAHINNTITLYNLNAKITQGTSDGADNGGIGISGGGDNLVSRGALVFLCGNEYSGANGALFLYSGNASSAYVEIAATSATLPTIRFKLTSTEQWRMSSSDLIGYESSSNLNQITRVNNLGRLILCGGTDSNTANGSSISLSGITYGGTLSLNAGNVSTGNIFYNALHASATHRFSIASSEKLRVSGAGIIFYNGTLMGAYRENDTGGSFLAGGSAIAVANGAYMIAYGNSHASLAGRMYLYSGTASGLMFFEMGLSTGAFRFRNSSAVTLLDISNASIQSNVPSGGDISLRVNSVDLFSVSENGLKLPNLADTTAANSRFYYSTTQNKPCYKDSSGVVNTLY